MCLICYTSHMDFTSHFTPLSHAYLIEADSANAESELLSILEDAHHVSFSGNPDAWKGSFGTFAIEHAREIKELASKKKVTDGKRVFVIRADTMTREASNALLKTLEEPGEGTHFFLILPSARRVLPTILSRVRVVRYAGGKQELSPDEFLSKTPVIRLAMVKEMLSKLEKEEITRGMLASFAEDIARVSRTEKAVTAAGYARDQSASLKMLLEYLALTA